MATACSQTSPSERVAKTFLQTYYRGANLQEALKITTGLASHKIEQEVKLGGGQATLREKDDRKFTIQKSEKYPSQIAPLRQELFYHIAIQVSSDETFERTVRITLEREGENKPWKVANFVEV